MTFNINKIAFKCLDFIDHGKNYWWGGIGGVGMWTNHSGIILEEENK